MTLPNPTEDTTGQERRARRILPYKQSMGRVGDAVKLRKYQLALDQAMESWN